MKTLGILLRIALLASFAVPSYCLAEADGQGPDNAAQNQELVKSLTKCSATYTRNILMLRGVGRNADRFVPMADWFYYGAAALSNKQTAKEMFTMHYQQYVDADNAMQKMNKDERVVAAKQFIATLNHDMDECDRVRTANKALVDRYLGSGS